MSYLDFFQEFGPRFREGRREVERNFDNGEKRSIESDLSPEERAQLRARREAEEKHERELREQKERERLEAERKEAEFSRNLVRSYHNKYGKPDPEEEHRKREAEKARKADVTKQNDTNRAANAEKRAAAEAEHAKYHQTGSHTEANRERKRAHERAKKIDRAVDNYLSKLHKVSDAKKDELRPKLKEMYSDSTWEKLLEKYKIDPKFRFDPESSIRGYYTPDAQRDDIKNTVKNLKKKYGITEESVLKDINYELMLLEDAEDPITDSELANIDTEDLAGALGAVAGGDDLGIDDDLDINDDEMDDIDLDDSDIDFDDDLSDLADDIGEEELTADEKKVASDMIATSVPSLLIKSEMDLEESVEFYSGIEASIAVNEGFLSPEYLDKVLLEMANESDEVMQEGFLGGNKTIVKFSKQALIARIKGICILKIARAHNDRDAVIYTKLNRQRKIYKARLKKKYDAEANRQTRLVIARMRKSKSPAIKKLSDKVTD